MRPEREVNKPQPPLAVNCSRAKIWQIPCGVHDSLIIVCHAAGQDERVPGQETFWRWEKRRLESVLTIAGDFATELIVTGKTTNHENEKLRHLERGRRFACGQLRNPCSAGRHPGDVALKRLRLGEPVRRFRDGPIQWHYRLPCGGQRSLAFVTGQVSA